MKSPAAIRASDVKTLDEREFRLLILRNQMALLREICAFNPFAATPHPGATKGEPASPAGARST